VEHSWQLLTYESSLSWWLGSSTNANMNVLIFCERDKRCDKHNDNKRQTGILVRSHSDIYCHYFVINQAKRSHIGVLHDM